jgi:hypothetical protein
MGFFCIGHLAEFDRSDITVHTVETVLTHLNLTRIAYFKLSFNSRRRPNVEPFALKRSEGAKIRSSLRPNPASDELRVLTPVNPPIFGCGWGITRRGSFG